jgi:hypothetical protein
MASTIAALVPRFRKLSPDAKWRPGYKRRPGLMSGCATRTRRRRPGWRLRRSAAARAPTAPCARRGATDSRASRAPVQPRRLRPQSPLRIRCQPGGLAIGRSTVPACGCFSHCAPVLQVARVLCTRAGRRPQPGTATNSAADAPLATVARTKARRLSVATPPVPSIGALVTGLLMSLGTRWGLFRQYWTLISLG